MIGRIFWFLLGVGVTVWVIGKLRESLRRASPEVVGQRVAASAAGVGATARDFTDRVRTAMAEREAELRDAFGTDRTRSGPAELPD
jgi:Ni,Fe-hydrogenase III large subunit